MRHVTAGILALAAIGFAGQAGAVISETETVNVNIDVTPVVSVWAQDTSIALVLDGGAVNEDLEESILYSINNVTGYLKVKTTGSLPVPSVPGGGINFFVFYEMNAATAHANILLDNYTPTGAKVWTNATLGTEYSLGSIPTSTSAVAHTVTYAADMPGELVAVSNWNLAVLYTISDTP